MVAMSHSLGTEGTAKIKIGATTNVLSGLVSSWDPTNASLNLINPTAKSALTTKTVRPIASLGYWRDLEVTLHESPQDLLTAVIPFKAYHAITEGTPPNFPAGGLLIGQKNSSDAIASLSNTLGVPLSSEYCYAYARVKRYDGEQLHSSRVGGVLRSQVHLTDDASIADYEFESDLRALAHTSGAPMGEQMAQLTKEEAKKYLDFFNTWGTHFVSRVELGDQIMQVFAYTKDNFNRLKQRVTQNTLSGGSAESFVQFTTDASAGTFGYVTSYGKLMIMSNDAKFVESVSNEEWLDTLWSEGHNSIFKAYMSPSGVPSYMFEFKFQSQAIVYTEVAPLTMYCEYERAEIWRRVLKAAACTVFRDAIDANFQHLDSRDFSSILPDDQPGVLSALPTPTISVYKARLDLSSIQLVAADQVNGFTACAYVASMQGNDLSLPGDNVQIYTGVLDARSTENANVLTLTDTAFTTVTVGCSTFLGVLRIENTSGTAHKVICDGLCYELDSGDYPAITKDVRVGTPLPEATLLSMKENLQFALTFGDAVLGAQQNMSVDEQPEIYIIARQFLKWIAQIIPSTTQVEELLQIRVRALLLSSYTPDSKTGAFVPLLESEGYTTLINRMMEYAQNIERNIRDVSQKIEERRAQELVIDVAQDLNQNVIQTGTLLAGFVKQSAVHQSEIATSFEQVITRLEAEATAEESRVDKLSVEVHQAQSDFDFRAQEFKSKLKQYQVAVSITAGIDIAVAVFSAGTAVAIPSSAISAVEKLGTVAQKLQKGLDVLKNLKEVYTAGTGLIPVQNAQLVLDKLNGSSFGDVSTMLWDELQIKFDEMIGMVPFDDRLHVPKSKVKAGFQMLLLKAKSLASARSQLHQTQSSIYEKHRQKELTERQRQRLETLTKTFATSDINSVDFNNIDLVGMTSMLGYRRDQVLASLSQAFLIQDQAFQYETLQTPTPISSYSLLNFLQGRSTQEAKRTHATTVLAAYQPTTTSIISYRVDGIPTSRVTDGNKRRVSISTSASEFRDYVFVRVKSVVLSVEGVASSDSGKMAIRLSFDNTPFVDRDLGGNLLTFNTPQRERIYEYSTDSSPLFTDNGDTWSENVSDVTPFGDWYVDFPDLSANAGLQFSSPQLSVTLGFVLETRISAARSTLRQPSFFAAPRSFGIRPKSFASRGLPPGKEAVIANFHTAGTACGPWDVIFCMNTTEINKVLERQYNDLEADPAFNNVIDTEIVSTTAEDITTTLTLENVHYDAPKVVLSTAYFPDFKLRISEGTLKVSKQIGSSAPSNRTIAMTDINLKVDSDGIFDPQGKFKFNFGEGTFSFLDKEPDSKDYYIFGAQRIESGHADKLFKAIASFFESKNLSFFLSAGDLGAKSEQILNTTLAKQYQDNVMSLNCTNSIIASASVVSPVEERVTKIDMEYGYPQISFQSGNDNEVSVSMKILSGSSSIFKRVGGVDTQTGTTKSLTNKSLDGIADLTKVAGTAEEEENTLEVKLNMEGGAYSSADLDLEPIEALDLSEKILAHFARNQVTYLINKLNLSEVHVGADLKPKDFRIKLMTTASGVEVMQLFIQTGDRELPAYSQTNLHREITEPLPLSFNCCFIMSRRLFFESVLKSSLTKDGWTVVKEGAAGQEKAKFENAVVTATNIDLSGLNGFTSGETVSSTTIYYVPNNRINWNLGSTGSDAMTLTPQADGSLELKGEKEQNIVFHKKVTLTWHQYYSGSSSSTYSESVSATSSVAGTMRLSVSGSGRNQQLVGSMADHGLTVNGHLSGGGACGCDDLEARVNQRLRNQLPPKIKSQLAVGLAPVSLFALKNLLFYKNNYIDLAQVSVPGDVVIFGSFVE